MWHLLVGQAIAGSSADEVTAALARHPNADAALVCSPVGTLLATASKLPLPPSLLQEAEPHTRGLLTLLDPATAAAAGVDRSGPLVLVSEAKSTVELRIPFTGTRAQAESLLAQLYTEVTPSGELWRVTEEGKARLAHLAEGVLQVDGIGAEHLPRTLHEAGPLLAGLPTQPGCTVVLRGVDTEKADGAVAAYVPLAGGAPLLVRVHLAQVAAPPELARGGPVGDIARTVEAPSLVLTVGVSIDSLLDALAKDPNLDLEDIATLHGLVAFGPGATVATFGNPQERRFAAVVPLTAPDGSTLPRRKVVRFLTRFSEGKVKRTGGATFAGQFEKTTVYGAVGDGRVVLGSDAALVQLVLADTGEPWLTPPMREYTAIWPITIQTRGTSGPFSLRAGLRTVGDVWELSSELTGGNPEMGALMAGMVSALAVPAIVEGAHKAGGAVVAKEVDAIRTAELAWLTDHGTALPLPAHPRSVEQLGKEPVDWPVIDAWAQLGWAPDGGRTRGTYWVEVTPDGEGFTVWGAVDADADGNPARFKATRDTPATKATGEKVY